MPFTTVNTLAKTLKTFCRDLFLAFPPKVECNLCGWRGRHFLSDAWHRHILCPRCRSEVRHRLFFAALQTTEVFSFGRIFGGKAVLHFAPEALIAAAIRREAGRYVTADLLRNDCDLVLDISGMAQVRDGSFDAVLAFDVLEHVPDFRKALTEIRRILSPDGFGIFTVPQKTGLAVTVEDPAVVTAEERIRHFGQADHLRIFGDDFSGIVESRGFRVTAVDASFFPAAMRKKNVLFPSRPSKHPLATHDRKIFFCRKTL
ncbi:MAG: methyltransferase domain-containing protein [Candidatus Omnitrophota bacterium]